MPGYIDAFDGALGIQIFVAILGGYGLKSYTFFALSMMVTLFEWYLFVQIKATIISRQKQAQPESIPTPVPLPSLNATSEQAAA